jgi:hypothetical protein
VLAPVASASFENDLERIEILAATPVTSVPLLVRNLTAIYERAARARFADYDVLTIAKAAPEVMYRLFDLRVRLRSQVSHYEMLGLMTPEVTQGFRDVFRVLRYVSDMLGEIASGETGADRRESGPPLRGFTGNGHNTLVNYAYYSGGATALPFQSGDVILVRGRAHNSAAIARIGDVDSQFSHIGIVHIDDAGKHWMVESLIEDGAVISPLAKALEHGIVRAVLYRHRDPKLAARAAKCIFDYVATSRAKGGKRILYDFSMCSDGEGRNLFCSKLVRLAYQQGSEGKCLLPSYPTLIAMKNRDFLDRVGVAAETTFAPADIDMEPGFDLVAEWQDYRETENIRLQDFTMDKLFEWMERYDYRFEETATVRLVSVFGRFASYLSDDAKQALSSALPRVPRNMPRKTVAAVAMLHRTAEPIYHELQRLDAEFAAENGVPMHGLDILAALEKIRERCGNRIGYLVRHRVAGQRR